MLTSWSCSANLQRLSRLLRSHTSNLNQQSPKTFLNSIVGVWSLLSLSQKYDCFLLAIDLMLMSCQLGRVVG